MAPNVQTVLRDCPAAGVELEQLVGKEVHRVAGALRAQLLQGEGQCWGDAGVTDKVLRKRLHGTKEGGGRVQWAVVV